MMRHETKPIWQEDDTLIHDPNFVTAEGEWWNRFGELFVKSDAIARIEDSDGSVVYYMPNGYALYSWMRGGCAIYKTIDEGRPAMTTLVPEVTVVGIPMLLICPECKCRHIDEGEFATKPHHTHACQYCGMVWRPAIGPTIGVRFLPGFKNEKPEPTWENRYEEAIAAVLLASSVIGNISGWSGSSGNWPLQEASGRIRAALDALLPEEKKPAALDALLPEEKKPVKGSAQP